MATLPDLPAPLAPEVQRYDASGRPTVQQQAYEARLAAFLKALAAAVQGT